ncbi:PH domain-containing protein [Myroides sp. M-43]|uniref:PH domain-containing protein n=1 Tax=Myroides oncorhynchi TaxID=2893756 RepID=UPI001E2C9974|nr:PH domain-containing protein [Myroides oncorhynchi]MCC9043250.1 PH domain-containing protein [Myroides oncorhynchi]
MRQSNFYRPTRQATIGIIANFLNALQKIVRAFVPLLIVFFVNKRMELPVSIWGLMIFGGVISLGIAYLSYRNFLFYIDKETNSFIIQKGIVNKSKVTIQLDKIQQVNLNQSFINRMINVYSVEIDSAGSKDKEATIPSMSLVDANALKYILLNSTNSNCAIENNSVQEESFIRRISVLTLFKVGMTANYLYTLGAILLFFNMLYDTLINKFAIQEYVNTDEVNTYVNRGIPAVVIFYVIILMVIIVLIVNVSRTFLKFWDFKVVLSKGTLLLSHGLLSTRNTIIRPNRVQKIEIVQNYLQSLLDICILKISQVSGEDTDNRRSGLQIPGCSVSEKNELFSILMKKGEIEYSTILRYNYRYLGFRIFVFIGIPVAVFSLLFIQEFTVSTFVSIIFVYSLVVGLALLRLYRVGRLYVSDSFIVIRKGIWDISYSYIQPHKIQKVVLSQLWWQQSSDIGSLVIYTAGGRMKFSTTNYNELVKLRDKWLYQVESTSLNWM